MSPNERLLDTEPGRLILQRMIAMIVARLDPLACEGCGRGPADVKAADFEMMRKLLSDNAVTFASIRRGDFGETAQRAAEEYPFPGDGPTMGTA